MNSKSEYIQFTLRIPRRLDKIINNYASEWGLTKQDAIIFMLLSCVGGDNDQG